MCWWGDALSLHKGMWDRKRERSAFITCDAFSLSLSCTIGHLCSGSKSRSVLGSKIIPWKLLLIMWFLLHPRTANLDVLFLLPVSLATLQFLGWRATTLPLSFRCRIYWTSMRGGNRHTHTWPSWKPSHTHRERKHIQQEIALWFWNGLFPLMSAFHRSTACSAQHATIPPV